MSPARRCVVLGYSSGFDMSGLIIFVESVRWLGRRWGMRSVEEGMREAGFRGEFLPWKWHSSRRGWLVLPATLDRGLIEREAERLAAFIVDRRVRQPFEPIHVIGYSFGGYIGLRALELLPATTQVDSAALLAAAFSPRRDLGPACRAVRDSLVVTSSMGDSAIVGMGTLLFGAADGRHTVSVGMVGTRWRGLPRLICIRWNSGMVRHGYLGGHFSVTAPGFVREVIAPVMQVGKMRSMA
jgi:pimeloyl-ACP methyl ester carboxylesterase